MRLAVLAGVLAGVPAGVPDADTLLVSELEGVRDAVDVPLGAGLEVAAALRLLLGEGATEPVTDAVAALLALDELVGTTVALEVPVAAGDGATLLLGGSDSVALRDVLSEAVGVGDDERVADVDAEMERVPVLVRLADGETSGLKDALGVVVALDVTDPVGKGVGDSCEQGPLMASSQGGRNTARNQRLAPALVMIVNPGVPTTCRSRCVSPLAVLSASVTTYTL